MVPYKIIEPTVAPVPIVVSVPHCGISFPEELRGEYDQTLIAAPDDTDWFVQQLYDFVPAMGITMIHAVNSRWVIDLNRDPYSKPLYHDGRIITALCPTTDFLGKPLYNDRRTEVASEEVDRRRALYYNPYHQKIQSLLDERKSQFSKVLLWDCHSIREYVKTIQSEKFPDLILGDADGASSSSKFVDVTLAVLSASRYQVSHNHPFKGGQITRHFGKPSQNVHALQLEMTKVNYMDDSERHYDATRADEVRIVLRDVFESLINAMNKS